MSKTTVAAVEVLAAAEVAESAADQPAEPKVAMTLDEVLRSIDFPVEELVRKLNELGTKNPDIGWLTGQAGILVAGALGYEKLVAFRDIVVTQLLTLMRTGSGPVTHDDVDLA